MALNLTNFAPMLKTLYTKEKVQNLVYKKNAAFAMFNKDEGFFGESQTVPLIYGNPQGRSATFATAQANKGNSSSIKFVVTRNRDYGLISIDNETIKASESDLGAFAKARVVEIDGMFQNIANTIEVDLFGSGSGSRGQVISTQTLSSSTVTLQEPQDIVKIEVGMPLVASSADGGGSVRSGVAYVISVDRKAGTFVVSSTAAGSATALNSCISAIAASDYLFVQGDYDAKIKGLKAWLPYSGPSSASFFGVDRTVDKTRLAGQWDDFSALPIEEGLVEAGSRMEREGASVDKVLISLTKLAELQKALGTRVQYVDSHVSPEISFQGIKLQLGNGLVSIYGCRGCPKQSAFFLQSDTWKLSTLGGAPMILNMDGLESLREATADAIEIRIGYYGQLICNAPGYNGHFKI